MPYHDLYGDVYERSFKNAAAVQNQILQQRQLAEQIRQHNAHQILEMAKYLRTTQDQAAEDSAANIQMNEARPPSAIPVDAAANDMRAEWFSRHPGQVAGSVPYRGGAKHVATYLKDATSGAESDMHANMTANEAVPPSAVAVGDEAPMDNAARGDYFAAHPTERTGPLVPYLGGSKGLSPYLTSNRAADPNSLPERRFAHTLEMDANKQPGGSGPLATAQATAQGVSAEHFQNIPVEELMGPNTNWDWVDSSGKHIDNFSPANTPLTGTETGIYAQATVPGHPPVKATTKGYLDLNRAWAKLQERKANKPAATSPYLQKAGPPAALETLSGSEAIQRPPGTMFKSKDGRIMRVLPPKAASSAPGENLEERNKRTQENNDRMFKEAQRQRLPVGPSPTPQPVNLDSPSQGADILSKWRDVNQARHTGQPATIDGGFGKTRP